MAIVVETASFERDGAAIRELVNECYKVEIGDNGFAFKTTDRIIDPEQNEWRDSYIEGRVLKISESAAGI